MAFSLGQPSERHRHFCSPVVLTHEQHLRRRDRPTLMVLAARHVDHGVLERTDLDPQLRSGQVHEDAALLVLCGRARLHLADLFVAEDHRRQGIGRALMEAVSRECARTGGRWLSWLVMEDNASAVAFYRQIGEERKGAREIVFDLRTR